MHLTAEQIVARLAGPNPFARRNVQPGRLSFRFVEGVSVSGLVEQLHRNAWMGEVVGPAGSGKTTLVHALVPSLKQAGRKVQLLNVLPNESRLPIAANHMQAWDQATQIVIDGYEQLGGWTRTLLGRICRTRRCGLLRISREPTGDPLLYSTHSPLPLVQGLVRDIQSKVECRVHEADVATSYSRHAGNVRDMFDELHDMYERRGE